MKESKSRLCSAGFSLVELMVALAIAGVVIAAVAGVFARSSRLYILENARAELQQEMRAAFEVMTRDMRMAVADPLNTKDFKIKNAQATHFRFTTDMNGNGTIDSGAAATEGCEMVSFRFSAANNKVDWYCNENAASQDGPHPLIGDTDIQVTALGFDYRNNQNQPESIDVEISSVVVTMTAQIAAGQTGMESRTLSTWIDLRNAGPNASK